MDALLWGLFENEGRKTPRIQSETAPVCLSNRAFARIRRGQHESQSLPVPESFTSGKCTTLPAAAGFEPAPLTLLGGCGGVELLDLVTRSPVSVDFKSPNFLPRKPAGPGEELGCGAFGSG